MANAFWMILHILRIQDLFDIAIIAILIYLYVMLVWFMEAASRFVMVGIELLGAVYISPAERLNQFRYHDNWLQNLLISAFFGRVSLIRYFSFDKPFNG